MQATLAATSELRRRSPTCAPLSPAMSRFHVGSTPQPSGVTMPIPVTTTRLIRQPQQQAARRTGRAGVPLRAVRRAPNSNTLSIAIERAAAPVSALRILLEKLHCVAARENGLGGIVRNLAPELLFERHHQFDGIEAVRAQILNEARLLRDLVGVNRSEERR